MRGSKGVMQQSTCSQASTSSKPEWGSEAGFPGAAARTHFSSYPSYHICTFGDDHGVCPLAHSVEEGQNLVDGQAA